MKTKIKKVIYVNNFKWGGEYPISQHVLVSLLKCGLLNEEKYYHEEEYKKLQKLLERISGLCGAPNANDACRNILKLIRKNKNE